jgi:glucose-6-phosphate 1-dehydrogenase
MEKPFGSDLPSARTLNEELGKVLREDQIFRIDHYLGKETVQNIMVFRFANGIFEPIWNRNFIESVQITVGETLGVENRGPYYEGAGALRDMVPNHLFQILALIAMEAPAAFQGNSVRDEKTKAIRAIRPMNAEEISRNVIRGQYGAGKIPTKSGSEPVPGYREEANVSPHSSTETFVAMKLWLDNWRWAGVPFYLRTGKRLAQRISEVRIRFRRAPYQIFRGTSCRPMEANQLLLQIQPEEKITLQFGAKAPGPRVLVKEVGMDFDYSETFGKFLNTGYETLLYDAMNGDPTLFMRADQIEASWAVVTPILEAWKTTPAVDFPNYPAGSWGPSVATLGKNWSTVCSHEVLAGGLPGGLEDRTGESGKSGAR